MEKADTAYTNVALPAHTDTTYFTDPVGLQAFHMLSHQAPPQDESTKEDLGGQSLLVDGFFAASKLRDQHPEAFKILRDTAIPWHASGNDGVAIAPRTWVPVISTSGYRDTSAVVQIRWNNADRGVIPLRYKEGIDKWYEAARLFDALLRAPENEYWFQLEPGTVLSK